MLPCRGVLRFDERKILWKSSILALLIYGSAAVVVITFVATVQSFSSDSAYRGYFIVFSSPASGREGLTMMSGQDIALLLAGHLAPLATLLSIFAGSLAAGLAGFAFSAISGAMLFHWLAPIDAVPLLLACSITTQLFSISKLWDTMRWRQCFPYLAGGFAGIPVGAKLLEGVSPHTFAAGFGLFLICYSVYMLLRPHLTCRGGGRWVEIAVGFAGGITGGATAFPGAFPTIWCNVRGMSKLEQRGIVQPFILLMQIATLIYFSKLGIFASATWTTFLWCVPAVMIGTWLGLQLFDRIDDARFRQVVLLFLLLSGATLVM